MSVIELSIAVACGLVLAVVILVGGPWLLKWVVMFVYYSRHPEELDKRLEEKRKMEERLDKSIADLKDMTTKTRELLRDRR